MHSDDIGALGEQHCGFLTLMVGLAPLTTERVTLPEHYMILGA